MTRDDIIRMAREAGLWPAVTDSFLKELQEFAALVAAAEREACSKTCEEYARKYAKDDVASKAQAWMMLQCAAAIRARGQS
jgi:hypothetical protein